MNFLKELIKRPAILAGLGIFAVLSLLAALLWPSSAPPPPPKPATSFLVQEPAPPPFEEPLPSLGEKVHAVDDIIFATLREMGLGPSRVHFQVEKGQGGKLTTIRATHYEGQEPAVILQVVASHLEKTPAKVRSKGNTLWVSLEGRDTHRLILLPPETSRQLPEAPVTPPAPAKPEPAKRARPRVALVIDDLGYRKQPVRDLLALGLPITFSVLPHSPHAAWVARQARAQGREVLVHLPMEPHSYPSINPGPGALLMRMKGPALAALTRRDLASVPGAVGANNHMGSRLTENRAAMSAVLGVLKEKGLFFLDSATSPRSVAYDTARKLGLATARRDIFLDHYIRPKAVKKQLALLLKIAGQKGEVIAIGHPHAVTIEALQAYSQRLRKEVELVEVSRLMRPADPGRAKEKSKDTPAR